MSDQDDDLLGDNLTRLATEYVDLRAAADELKALRVVLAALLIRSCGSLLFTRQEVAEARAALALRPLRAEQDADDSVLVWLEQTPTDPPAGATPR